MNLVDNAVRYAKSSVVVSVSRDGPWAELAVTDDGPGIPAADRERAFGRFARLDDARSRDGDEAGGAGLGLAIVRATAQAYGGTAVRLACQRTTRPGTLPGRSADCARSSGSRSPTDYGRACRPGRSAVPRPVVRLTAAGWFTWASAAR